MKLQSIAAVFGLFAAANAIELTVDNWDSATAGKTVMIKFHAPWCGNCKTMKPAWDELMAAFADSKTQLVADVDCTAAGGEELCELHGIQGYPTVKWGDPSALEEYEGGRDYETLKEFADENLKPMCSPANIDLCDADKKKEIEKYMAMSAADLDKLIEEKVEAQAKIEEDFSNYVQGLQQQYQDANVKKEEDLAAIKESGLGLMKAVKANQAAAAAGGSDEL